MNIKVDVEKVANRKYKGIITVWDRSGTITLYADTSHTISPSWLERNAIRAAGSKALLRQVMRDAIDAANG